MDGWDNGEGDGAAIVADAGESGGSGGSGGRSGGGSEGSGGDPPRRTRGRTRKAKGDTPQEAPEIAVEQPKGRKRGTVVDSGAIAALYGVVSQIAASQWGAHWQFSPEENDALGKATANAAKHIPSRVGKRIGAASDIGGLGIALIMVLLPRWQFDQQMRAERKRQTPTPTPLRNNEREAEMPNGTAYWQSVGLDVKPVG